MFAETKSCEDQERRRSDNIKLIYSFTVEDSSRSHSIKKFPRLLTSVMKQ